MKSLKGIFFGARQVSQSRRNELIDFCKPLGIKFNDIDLLDLAFHHRSYSNENIQHKRYNNERLEFLGDSVLGMATAAFLYEDMAENPEGDLAKIKAAVVSEKALAPIGLSIGVDRMLVLGKGEEMTGGRKKHALIADCVEAVIGAYYIDSGYEKARDFVLKFIVPEIRKVQQNRGNLDYKTLLQEYFQKQSKQCPYYELIKTEGPDHDQKFFVSVHLGEKVFGPASGKSKKEAEQKVAEIAYEKIK
ncbi:MAG: ribonuclease III [Treponema sp.]|uniref:ribonuclease III n=1 Tax=Treponema sp. TaxID=166 RepID=UPI001B72108E|nr:ribonuclease III [Treponema sp.]MBP5402791.1 ribonuclease III [Treponema sp.]MBR5934496.1 ribonuclease III [Treponema sp.]